MVRCIEITYTDANNLATQINDWLVTIRQRPTDDANVNRFTFRDLRMVSTGANKMMVTAVAGIV